MTPRTHKRKENSDVSESMPRTDKKPRVAAAQQGAPAAGGAAAVAAAGADGPEAAVAGTAGGVASGGGVQDLQTVLHLQKMNQVGALALGGWRRSRS